MGATGAGKEVNGPENTLRGARTRRETRTANLSRGWLVSLLCWHTLGVGGWHGGAHVGRDVEVGGWSPRCQPTLDRVASERPPPHAMVRDTHTQPPTSNAVARAEYRSSTRDDVRAVVGKAFGSTGSSKSSAAILTPPSTASTCSEPLKEEVHV